MAISTNADKLRKQLLKQLETEDFDYGRFLELTLELSEFDEDNVRFSVDASHISRLGRELVVKKETAVAELVKNAYDADSTQVTLNFENAELAGGRLIIEDDGQGMTREQLIAGFMRLSTTEKIRQPYSPKFHRLRAGKKGIGRFAAHRLGKKIIIITQTRKSISALKVEINWSKFKENSDLITISNQIIEVEKIKNQGTTIVVDDLEDGWTIASLERVYRYLTDLVQPFPISKILEMDSRDPGFEIKIYNTTSNEKLEVASADKLIFENALANIEASVDEKGYGSWTLKSKQLGIKEKKNYSKDGKNKEPFKFERLRNINLRAFYYIYNTSQTNYLPKHLNTLITSLAKERGGIRVYRNGFRVLPFGEPENDWLGLDARTARREILPPGRNRNFFGFVELVDPKGNIFEETSSRTGLIDNLAFQELTVFLQSILTEAVLRIAELREKKLRPTARVIPIEDRLKKTTENLKQILTDIKSSSDNTSVTKSNAQPSVEQLVLDTISSLEEITKVQVEENKVLINEISMLRVLASLGLAIGQFNHEIRHMFPALLADASSLIQAESGREYEIATRLRNNIQSFRTYTSYFDKSVSANARRETAIQDVGKILRSFWDVITPACQRRGIEFPEPTIHGYDLFTIPMHSSEWTSILFNLFTNSRKAIVRAGRDIGKILVIAGKEKGNIYIEFADNGDGIPSEDRERIFDAFFTTSLTSLTDLDENEDEDLLGTGLGLKILKDIVTSYNGEIALVGAPRGYVTCFRIEIPSASKEQLEAYGY